MTRLTPEYLAEIEADREHFRACSRGTMLNPNGPNPVVVTETSTRRAAQYAYDFDTTIGDLLAHIDALEAERQSSALLAGSMMAESFMAERDAEMTDEWRISDGSGWSVDDVLYESADEARESAADYMAESGPGLIVQHRRVTPWQEAQS